MELSIDQEKALNKILEWYYSKNKSQYITLGGYAGTGKTTLISLLKTKLSEISSGKIKIAFCSYTGRATQNLKNKLTSANNLNWKDTISTIHGLIYDPIENAQGVIIGWIKKDSLEKDLIIVDEASMIDINIWQDLLSYSIPILAVGDHGQLPPIQGNFNLMANPMLKLEQIHRQEKNNPIIEISIHARTAGNIPTKKFSNSVIKFSREDYEFNEKSEELLENYNSETLILCGYNNTRNKINRYIRNSLGYETDEPRSGDRVICLRNNNKKGIYNGMLGTIVNIKKESEKWYQAEIQMDEQKTLYTGLIFAPQFNSPLPYNFTKDRIQASAGDLFDFGYALTVHKAQGSQAKRVVLFEEKFSKMDESQWKRWLYTAVTRAEEELYIFGG